MTAKTAAKGGFTPGPWFTLNPRALAIYAQRNGERELIAATEVLSCDGTDASAEAACDEEYANARLIAAAPEMYQALQDILGSGSIQEAERIAFAVLDKLKEEAHG